MSCSCTKYKFVSQYPEEHIYNGFQSAHWRIWVNDFNLCAQIWSCRHWQAFWLIELACNGDGASCNSCLFFRLSDQAKDNLLDGFPEAKFKQEHNSVTAEIRNCLHTISIPKNHKSHAKFQAKEFRRKNEIISTHSAGFSRRPPALALTDRRSGSPYWYNLLNVEII